MRYSVLVGVYEKLESTTKRLDKTFYLSEFLKKVGEDDIERVVLLLQGRVFPSWDERELGVASNILIKAISVASGIGEGKVEEQWKKLGDLGMVAEKLVSGKRQRTLASAELAVGKVFDNLRKLPEITGQGAVNRKVQLVSELLTSAKPKEALYITRTVLNDLRVGLGSGTLRDAVAWAYFPRIVGINDVLEQRSFKDAVADFRARNALRVKDVSDLKNIEAYDFILAEDEKTARAAYNFIISAVEQAYNLTNDFGVVARAAKKGLGGLRNINLMVGSPVKVMLALKVDTISEGFEMAGKPLAAEYKLDGFRMLVHKKENGEIKIFTRRLDDVSRQFPDVVGYVKEHVKGSSFIIDSEAVGFDPKTRRYLPFQNISQRIRRKYDIGRMSAELPVEVNVFDILEYNGRSLINEQFRKRRELVEKIVSPVKRSIVVVPQIVSGDGKEIMEFFGKSVKEGNEGIMLKNLDAPYKPGARVGYMLKYKEAMEPLELVIVGAEWGTGKRATWLSSFVLACRSGDKFLGIGKVGTGVKEKSGGGVSFKELTKLLKPLITEGKGKVVRIKPEIVVEVAYEEIQQSSKYESGFALRFPRVLKLREDRSSADASEIKYVNYLFEHQRFKKR